MNPLHWNWPKFQWIVKEKPSAQSRDLKELHQSTYNSATEVYPEKLWAKGKQEEVDRCEGVQANPTFNKWTANVRIERDAITYRVIINQKVHDNWLNISVEERALT